EREQSDKQPRTQHQERHHPDVHQIEMLPDIKESIVVVQPVPVGAYGGKQLLKLLCLLVEPWLILTTDEFFPECGLGHLIFILKLRQFETDHPGHQKSANTRKEAHPDERTGNCRKEW